ncbi:replicative DNA helicase [Leptotrichia buccalis]|jgi:replicative DNA helicase|uniref:Replicative DNA helicase n=1 Tax=Leptotrichia buccalis (strain ATCC 14201 / DSM 1135 / JCM 12969 / NCTC 10249 / C-1013-b) TaxID=523794 RepID=C7ND38_LEPBD|nr:replicative DNA helicase [Leptotrichia buccalis]ACV39916.1 replicative DNA helicase [Leptotrichia buccalis C-1013-b]
MALYNSEDEEDRGSPFSIKAEEALLGSIFINPNVMGDIVDVITAEDFYKNNYKLIFSEMVKAYNNGKIIDVLLIIESLKKNEVMEEVGGEDIIYDLTEVVPTAANAVNYAQIIKEKSIQRQLITIGEKIVKMAMRGYENIDAMLDKSESMIFKIAESKQKKDIVPLADLVQVKISHLDSYTENKGKITGISSGFSRFDNITSGFHGSDLLILAARPAMGKTAFALNLATNVAKQGKSVLVYSLEMGNEQLFDRLIASESKIRLKSLKDSTLTSEELISMGNGLGRLSELPIYISDSSSVTMLDIKATARRLKSEGKLDFMLIDYLQLISPAENSRKSREQEISEISRSLKILAKELNIPIVTLSQLSRGVEQRVDKRPILSDLRESGAIEQDADMVMFLYREKYYNKDTATEVDNVNIPSKYTQNFEETQKEDKSEMEKVELIIGKHRSGPTGTIELGFRPSYQQFVNVVDDEFAPSPE